MAEDERSEIIAYRFGRFELDPRRLYLTSNGEPVVLPQKALDVLAALLERPGQLLTKEELLARVWPTTIVEENNLARQISTLRKALHDSREHREFIATVAGAGYRFVAPVHAECDRSGADDSAARHPDAGLIAPPPPPMPPPDARVGGSRQAALSSRWIAVATVALVVAATGVPFERRTDAGASGAAERGTLRRLTYGGVEQLQRDPSWSPDGRRVAFASTAAGSSDIWIQGIDQALPERLTTSDAQEWQPAWSPDGRWIAFRSEADNGGLVVMPASGGEARHLSSFGYRPRWSPSGHLVLFEASLLRGRWATPYVIGLDGAGPRPVRPDLAASFRAVHAAWHPDGERISFWGRDSEGHWRFVTTSLEPGGPVVSSAIPSDVLDQIDADGLTLAAFVWTPDGRSLLFEGASGDTSNLWRVGIDEDLRWTGALERLTIGPGRHSNPVVSPDGTRVAFSALAERTRLWAFPTGGETPLTPADGEPVTSGTGGEYDAAAPLDGLRVAFRTERRGRHQLWARSLPDGVERVLLAGGATDTTTSPRWSSDGRMLAYARRDERGRATSIGLIDAADGLERIVHLPPGTEAVPDDWSDDQSTILAACRPRPGDPYGVCLVPVTAGAVDADLRVLTASPNHSLICARFSPDGRWISFMAVDRRAPDRSILYLMPAEGGAWIRVTDGGHYDDKPRWSPDGRSLYFVSNRSGPMNLWEQPIGPDGYPIGEPVAVTELDSPARLFSTPLGRAEIAVSEGRVFLPLTDAEGDIWMLSLP